MNNKPTILFLFNSSNYAVQPWLDDMSRPIGVEPRFNCVSVDYSDTDHSDTMRVETKHPRHWRIDMDLSGHAGLVVAALLCDIAAKGLQAPSLVLSFPPCTDLLPQTARSARGKQEANPHYLEEAVDMCKLASMFDCPYGIENPISRLSTLWRKPDMYWHPWQFSCLFDAVMECSIPLEHPEFPGLIADGDWYPKKSCLWTGNGFVHPRVDSCDYGPRGYSDQYNKLGGKSARTKHIRSLTPRGFAMAVYLANKDAIGGTYTE